MSGFCIKYDAMCEQILDAGLLMLDLRIIFFIQNQASSIAPLTAPCIYRAGSNRIFGSPARRFEAKRRKNLNLRLQQWPLFPENPGTQRRVVSRKVLSSDSSCGNDVTNSAGRVLHHDVPNLHRSYCLGSFDGLHNIGDAFEGDRRIRADTD
jgi:hypothetical protein